MSTIPVAATPTLTTMWTRRSSTTLGAPAATVTISSLTDSLYRMTANGSLSAGLALRMLFNNDSGANYDNQLTGAAAGANAATRATGDTFARLSAGVVGTNLAFGFQVMAAKPLAGSHAHFSMQGARHIAAGVQQMGAEMNVGRWTNAAAKITRIDFTLSGAGNFNTGSVFTVAGIA